MKCGYVVVSLCLGIRDERWLVPVFRRRRRRLVRVHGEKRLSIPLSVRCIARDICCCFLRCGFSYVRDARGLAVSSLVCYCALKRLRPFKIAACRRAGGAEPSAS